MKLTISCATRKHYTFLEKVLLISAVLVFISLSNVPASLYQMELDSRHLSTRVVHTRYGTLRGFISTLSNRQLQPVEVFLGVPYAGAPIGPLRFMPPVTSTHWKGVRLADSHSHVCPQKLPDIKNETEALKKMPFGRYRYLQKLLPQLVNQSEDCLYLNIYAPAVAFSFAYAFLLARHCCSTLLLFCQR
ncbi:neuroligin-4, X-linked-like [Stegodyphus dumicola]|nr:neuroligin-4, X-linked-like [Stegodyphus dumicola]